MPVLHSCHFMSVLHSYQSCSCQSCIHASPAFTSVLYSCHFHVAFAFMPVLCAYHFFVHACPVFMPVLCSCHFCINSSPVKLQKRYRFYFQVLLAPSSMQSWRLALKSQQLLCTRWRKRMPRNSTRCIAVWCRSTRTWSMNSPSGLALPWRYEPRMHQSPSVRWPGPQTQ